MKIHPAYSDISGRLSGALASLRKGLLGPDEGALLLEEYALPDPLRPGVLQAGHSGAADPATAGTYAQPHTVGFTISTAREDRDGDVVVPSGCVHDDYSRNPVVFFGHQSWEVPVGRARGDDGTLYLWAEEARLKSACRFDDRDEDAMFVHDKVVRGYLNAASIAFVPIEAYKRDGPGGAPSVPAGIGDYPYGGAVAFGRMDDYEVEHGHPYHGKPIRPVGWYFKKYNLTEWSIVGVPANAGAIRDSLDREKGYITPRLQKALVPYCAQARGRCFSGWCPPCGNALAPGLVEKGRKKRPEPAKGPGRGGLPDRFHQPHVPTTECPECGGEGEVGGHETPQPCPACQGWGKLRPDGTPSGRAAYDPTPSGPTKGNVRVHDRDTGRLLHESRDEAGLNKITEEEMGLQNHAHEGTGSRIRLERSPETPKKGDGMSGCGCDECSKGHACPCEEKGQPSDHIPSGKACQILEDGEANGRPLTEAQRGMFGAACGAASERSAHGREKGRSQEAQEAAAERKRAREQAANMRRAAQVHEQGAREFADKPHSPYGRTPRQLASHNQDRARGGRRYQDFDDHLKRTEDPPPQAGKGLHSTSGTAGGYLIPEEKARGHRAGDPVHVRHPRTGEEHEGTYEGPVYTGSHPEDPNRDKRGRILLGHSVRVGEFSRVVAPGTHIRPRTPAKAVRGCTPAKAVRGGDKVPHGKVGTKPHGSRRPMHAPGKNRHPRAARAEDAYRQCPKCGGSGSCPECGGTGTAEDDDCKACKGKGECSQCEGFGVVGGSAERGPEPPPDAKEKGNRRRAAESLTKQRHDWPHHHCENCGQLDIPPRPEGEACRFCGDTAVSTPPLTTGDSTRPPYRPRARKPKKSLQPGHRAEVTSGGRLARQGELVDVVHNHGNGIIRVRRPGGKTFDMAETGLRRTEGVRQPRKSCAGCCGSGNCKGCGGHGTYGYGPPCLHCKGSGHCEQCEGMGVMKARKPTPEERRQARAERTHTRQQAQTIADRVRVHADHTRARHGADAAAHAREEARRLREHLGQYDDARSSARVREESANLIDREDNK